MTGDYIVNYAELKAAAEQLEKLASGLKLVTTIEREWCGETYSQTSPNWFGIAILLHRLALS